MIESSGRFVELADVNEATLARLHHKLEQRATETGLLDVAFHTIDSPVGPLLLAATPLGLVRVAYQREGHDAVLQALASTISPRILAAPRRLDDVARQLDEYFAGRPYRVRRRTRPPAFRRLPPHGSRPPGRHLVRAHRKLRRGGGRHRTPWRCACRRQRLCDQPASGGGPLPPSSPLGRLLGRLPRRAGGQASTP